MFNNKAQENVGMVMIFTLVSAAQEWMNNYSDSEKQRKQDDDNKRREKEMEAELVSIEQMHFTDLSIFMMYLYFFSVIIQALKSK